MDVVMSNNIGSPSLHHVEFCIPHIGVFFERFRPGSYSYKISLCFWNLDICLQSWKLGQKEAPYNSLSISENSGILGSSPDHNFICRDSSAITSCVMEMLKRVWLSATPEQTSSDHWIHSWIANFPVQVIHPWKCEQLPVTRHVYIIEILWSHHKIGRVLESGYCNVPLKW